MMKLYDRLVARNTIFKNETNEILTEYKSKLDNILNSLLSETVDVEWKHINYEDELEGKDDKLSVHGLIAMNIGDTLYDPDTNKRVTITEENKTQYLKYIRLLIPSNHLEHSSVEEIVALIKKMHKLDKKISGEEFQLMDLPISGKAH